MSQSAEGPRVLYRRTFSGKDVTSDTWKRIKSILDGALLLNPRERSAFLDEACGEDTEIRSEVESLLGTDVPTDFLERAPAPPESGLAPGEVVSSYLVLEEIGRGGMGVVYRAVHRGLDREFALKTLKVSPVAHLGIERFQREAKVLGALKHPHIVDVTDFGIEGELPYLVMELLSGPTLRQRCSQPLSADEALNVLDSMALAVDYAHSRGVLHGDLKPDNVILTPGGCKILDFGLSGLVRRDSEEGAGRRRPFSSLSAQDSESQFGTLRAVAGTPSYMAPELFDGVKPTVASDLYAFAVVAFEILVGQRPFVITQEAFHSGRWRRPSTPRPSSVNPALPAEVDGSLMTALSENPAERPPSAADFTKRLRVALERGRLRERRRRGLPRRLVASMALAGVLGLSSSSLWNMRWCRRMENRILDLKWSLLPRTTASPEILLLTVDDRWLAANPKSLSQQGDLFGTRLSSLFSAGARAIALDIVLPAEWSDAEEFSRLVLSYPDQLTLAAFGSFGDGTIRGRESLHPLTASILGPERVHRLFGLVNLEPDDDAVVRKGRWGFTDREGRMHLAWAARAALTLREELSPRDPFYLDQSLPIDSVATMSLYDVPEALRTSPDLVRDKLVIVGATYEGSADTFRATDDEGRDRSFPGAFVQANLVHTLIAGVRLREVGQAPVLVVCGISIAALALLLILPVPRPVSFAAPPAALLVFGGVSIAAFRWFHLLLPAAGPLTSLLLAIASAALVRRLLP
jgi:serine/threonine-protein kinase